MTSDWDKHYYLIEPFPLGPEDTGGKIGALNRGFKLMLSQREERIRKLTRLMTAYGIRLDGSDKSFRRLFDFFMSHLAQDQFEPKMAPEIYELCRDICILIGETVIQRSPNWDWCILNKTRTREYGYHQYGLMSEDPPGVVAAFKPFIDFGNQQLGDDPLPPDVPLFGFAEMVNAMVHNDWRF